MERRSDCPISNVLDHVGDKWSLLILRDLMFFGKNTYSELQNSDEKMATNILSSRLEKLEKDGLLTKETDKKDKRRKVYRLTEAGIDMLPILLDMIAWSCKYEPETNTYPEFYERIQTDRPGLIQDLTLKLKNEALDA
jgi:DNA-binding HxlR family transcriptional regulator